MLSAMKRARRVAFLIPLLSVTIAAALPAQTAAQGGAAPQIVIETTGPDGWRARLGPTNLGGMLSSREGRALWEPQITPMFGMWQSLIGDEQQFDAARDRLLSFSGSIRLALHFEPEGRHDIAQRAALVLDGDGRTSLTDLAAELRQLLDRGAPGKWVKAEIAGAERQYRGTSKFVMCEPFVRDDRLLVLMGAPEGLDESLQLADALCRRPLTIDARHPTSPALRVELDARALVEMSELFDDDEARAIGTALGFDSLDKVTLTVGTAGPRVQADVAVSFRSEARGLFAAFMPKTVGVSQLARLLPAKTSGWKVGRFDFLALGKALVDAIESVEEEDARAEFRKEFGFDLIDDLLVHMDDDVIALGSPLQDFDRALESTWALAFGLKDEAKFRPAITKMLKKATPFLDRAETTDVDGVELWRFGNLLQYDVWIAVGNGMLVVTGGRDGEEEAAALLRRAKQPDLADATAAQVGDVKRHLPEGLQGLSFLDIDSVVSIPMEWWFELIEELVPFAPRNDGEDLDELEERREQMRALLKQNRLDTVRTATGYAQDTWRWRLFW